MKKQKSIFLIFSCFFNLLFFSYNNRIHAQMPNPALIGYWHNWNDPNAPYIPLDQVDSRYNVIEVSFAVPTSPSDMTMLFTPDVVSQNTFISNVQTLQSQGKKVLISIGGANSSIDLTTTGNKTAFISSMNSLIDTYNFDGLDIDIENGNSILAGGGTISVPTNPAVVNLIDAIKQIMANHFTTHSKKLLLTMAPETAYVQGGQSAFGGIWGGYLPLIDALKDSLDILHVQLYNSGSMFGLDGSIYIQGTADFIVAMSEAAILGFTTSGGQFTGLPAEKIAVGLPACSMAAGGGFTDTNTVKSALDYLMGKGPKPGSYTLIDPSGYADLRGMMTWSINWDAVSSCGGVYEYASNFGRIFNTTTTLNSIVNPLQLISIFPNPAKENVYVQISGMRTQTNSACIYNTLGELVLTKQLCYANESIPIKNLPKGLYFISIENFSKKLLVD